MQFHCNAMGYIDMNDSENRHCLSYVNVCNCKSASTKTQSIYSLWMLTCWIRHHMTPNPSIDHIQYPSTSANSWLLGLSRQMPPLPPAPSLISGTCLNAAWAAWAAWAANAMTCIRSCFMIRNFQFPLCQVRRDSMWPWKVTSLYHILFYEFLCSVRCMLYRKKSTSYLVRTCNRPPSSTFLNWICSHDLEPITTNINFSYSCLLHFVLMYHVVFLLEVEAAPTSLQGHMTESCQPTSDQSASEPHSSNNKLSR